MYTFDIYIIALFRKILERKKIILGIREKRIIEKNNLKSNSVLILEI